MSPAHEGIAAPADPLGELPSLLPVVVAEEVPAAAVGVGPKPSIMTLPKCSSLLPPEISGSRLGNA